jgi:diaminopimelate decarboxylase
VRSDITDERAALEAGRETMRNRPRVQSQRGDLLAIRSAGAYGEVKSSQYNLRTLPKAYSSEEI